MKIAISQPTYLPWMGYFDLIDQVDCFVVLDNVQFAKQSWQHRNRIKTPRGLQWLTVPVVFRGRLGQRIYEVEIREDAFSRKHLRAIELNYRRAPHFESYYTQLQGILQRSHGHQRLLDLNLELLRWCLQSLAISTPLVLASKLEVAGRRAELLASICRALKADTYLSPLGSAEYLLPELSIITSGQVTVEFQRFEHPEYHQLFPPFQPLTSVLDLLMNEGNGSLAILRSGRRLAFRPEEVQLATHHGSGVELYSAPASDPVEKPGPVEERRSPELSKQLTIYCDVGIQVGTGHVMRCLALAQAWRRAGGTAKFVVEEALPSALQRVQAEGFAATFPAEWQEAQGGTAPWSVLDGYCFDAAHQRRLQNFGWRVLFVDDYGHASNYSADIVLNENVNADPELYSRRSRGTLLLLGPSFALLRDEFLRQVSWRPSISATASKLLITLGGSDPENLTGRVLESLTFLEPRSLHVVVVVGGANPHLEEIECQARQLQHRVEIVRNVSNLADYMKWADIAVSGAGVTSYELCFMGVPTLVLALASNQRGVARSLGEIGAAIDAGDAESFRSQKFASVLSDALGAMDQRLAISRTARMLLDGLGADRVRAAMQGRILRLRNVAEEDSRLLFAWARDPEVRTSSFHLEPIEWEEHERWLTSKLSDPRAVLYIGESVDGPIGLARFQITDDRAALSVNIDKSVRGRGWGRELVYFATRKVFREMRVTVIDAFVKPENSRSVSLFESAQFRSVGEIKVDEQRALHYVLEAESMTA